MFPYLFANSLVTIAVTAPIVGFVVVVLCWLIVVPNVSLMTTCLLVVTETFVARYLGHMEFVFLSHNAPFLVNVQRLVVAAARCGLAGIFFIVLHKAELHTYSIAYFGMMFVLTIVLVTGPMMLYGRPQFHPKAGKFLFGISFALFQFVRSISWSVDKMALSLMLSYDQIGIYNAGSRMLQGALVPIGFVARDNYRNFFRVGLSGIEATLSYARSILVKVVGVSVISSLAAAMFALLLPYLLGSRYEHSATVGAIISLGGVAIALQNLAGDILTGAGGQATRTTIASALIALTSGAIFLGAWLYGLVGAAVGFVAAQSFSAGVMWLVVVVLHRRRLRHSNAVH
jgi:O-antigen/teichoic acid export membrane protein